MKVDSQNGRQKAFTLIELLVVLVIISIIIMVTVLMFANFGRARGARMALEQLISTLKIAQQQAILQSQVLGLHFTRHGYRFYQYKYVKTTDTRQWLPLPGTQLSEPNAFSGNTEIKLRELNNRENFTKKSLILFLPDAYVTPFELQIDFKKQCLSRIIVTGNGQVQKIPCAKTNA